MGMFGSVVLLLVGVLAASSDLCRHRPGWRFWLDQLSPFQGYLGIGAALYGLFLTVKWVAYLGFIRHAPFVYLATVSSGVVAMAVGSVLGFRTAERWAGTKVSPRYLAQAEQLYQKLVKNQITLGYAAIWLGVFGVLLNVFT